MVGRIAGAGQGWTFLPGLRAATDALDNPLHLSRRNDHAAGPLQRPLGFQGGRLIGAFRTNEFGQGRRVTDLQAQRGVRRTMPLLLAWVMVVIPLQVEATKNPLRLDGRPALALLPRLGLVTGIGLIGGSLQQAAHQRISGWENRRAHQDLQLGHGLAV
jgi:hypothetical protein